MRTEVRLSEEEVTDDILASFSRVLGWKARLQGGNKQTKNFNMSSMRTGDCFAFPFPDEPIAMNDKKWLRRY